MIGSELANFTIPSMYICIFTGATSLTMARKWTGLLTAMPFAGEQIFTERLNPGTAQPSTMVRSNASEKFPVRSQAFTST